MTDHTDRGSEVVEEAERQKKKRKLERRMHTVSSEEVELQ